MMASLFERNLSSALGEKRVESWSVFVTPPNASPPEERGARPGPFNDDAETSVLGDVNTYPIVNNGSADRPKEKYASRGESRGR